MGAHGFNATPVAAPRRGLCLRHFHVASSVYLCFHTRFSIAQSSWFHLLVPVTLTSLWVAFRALKRRDFVTHRITMQTLYVSACVIAGGFTLLPSRYLGQLIWHEWLGWI